MKLNIGTRLILAFVVVLVLTAIAGGAGVLGLARVRGSSDEVAQRLRVTESAQNIEIAMLQARRSEKNFLLRYKQVGIEQARAEYAAQVEAEVAQIHRLTGDIRALAKSSQTLALVDDIDRWADAYWDSFEEIVRQVTTRGHVDTGLEGEFRGAVHEIEASVGAAGADDLTIIMLQIRRREKDYLLRSDEEYVTKVENLVAQLKATIAGHSLLSSAESSRLQAEADTYLAAFDKLVQADKGIAAAEVGLQNAARGVEPAVDNLVADATAAAGQAAAGQSQIQNLVTLVIGVTALVAIVVGIGVGLAVTNSIRRPLARAVGVAERLGRGDLTCTSGIKSQDEFGALGAALDSAIVNLRDMIAGLADDSTRLSTTAAQLAASSEELSRVADSQADQIGRTSSTTEEMVASTQEIARNAGATAEAATASSRRAQSGASLVADTASGLERASQALERLHLRSDEIGKIITLIQEIASQTNILALNAAIEAAGAGAAGARFDVVAEEIRQLASRTSQATGEIVGLIDAVQTDTDAAAEAMGRAASLAQEAGRSLTDIVEASASVNDMVQIISSATEQQSKASEDIKLSLETIVNSSQQTVVATRETAQSGVELSDMAERLKEAASRFKV